MRKTISLLGLAAVIFFFAGCGSTQESGGDLQGKSVAKVTEFLQFMTAENRPANLMDFISPSYIKAAGINPSEYMVNTYYPKSFIIERSYPSPDVTNSYNVVATITGENGGWAHRLTFVVFNDNGKLTFYPGKVATDSKFIDPWYTIEEYVK